MFWYWVAPSRYSENFHYLLSYTLYDNNQQSNQIRHLIEMGAELKSPF